MPTNDGSVCSQNEFNDILNEISSILRTYNDHLILIGGDFNLDLIRDRNTRYFDLFNDFSMKESLISNDCIFDLTGDSYTYESPNGTKSTIDHYLFCDNFYSNVESFKVFIEGHNLSDHQPLYIEYQLENCPEVVVDECIDKNQTCDWSSATKQDVDLFKLLLNDLLEGLLISLELLECNDMSCKDHTSEVIDHFNNVVECAVLASKIAIPKRKNKFVSKNTKSSKMPGWNDYVRYYRDKSIWWHKI